MKIRLHGQAKHAKLSQVQEKHFAKLVNDFKKQQFLGNVIQKKLYPKKLKSLPNLFRIQLPQGWRLLYSIVRDTVFIVFIGNHTEYERFMNYS